MEPRLMMAVTPIINEFMASNDNTLDDVDGNSSDWIELYNPGDTPLNLDGYYLTHDPQDLDRWRLPAVTINAGGYLVIFASEKNRINPVQELHTDFLLGANDGYLALVGPDGTSVLSEYTYPTQLTDVSYGQMVQSQITKLVNTNASVKWLIPPNGNLGTGWTTREFNDGSWTTGNTGVGYDLNVPPPPIPGFTVKMVDFDEQITDIPTATRLLDGVNTTGYTIRSVTTRDYLNVNHGPGGSYSPDLPLPDGSNETEQYALRATAKIFIPAGTWTFDIASDDGIKLTLSPDAGFSGVTFTGKYNESTVGYPTPVAPNVLVFSQPRGHAHTGGTITVPAGGFRGNLVMDFYENTGGDDAEISVSPGPQGGWNSNFVLLGDGALPGWQVTTSAVPPPSYLPLIGTNSNVQGPMLNNNSTAYMRLNFNVLNTNEWDILKLRMKYDDGFVAYVNGTEVARRNAPGATPWNSASSGPRDDADAFIYEDINIPKSALVLGTNVLAIHGLNQSAGDEDFIIYPELEGIRILSSEARYFSVPTPGAANNTSNLVGVVGDTNFNTDRGFYNTPFQLDITTDTVGAEIRYTLNGVPPTATTGTVFTGPITIDKTTVVRAAAFKPGFISSNVDTETYIFTSDVITQSPNGEAPNVGGTQWPVGPLLPENQVMNYGMDPDIVNSSTWGPQVQDALKHVDTIPTFSVVMDVNGLFAPNGIYSNPHGDGLAFEKPASLELIYPDGTEGFQIDAGIRLRGGFSRDANNPKHAFRFFFRDEYGEGKLNFPLFGPDAAQSFDGFDLRTFQNYSWAYQGDQNGIFLRDVLSRDAQVAMGQPGKRGNFFHLYINGQYWGVYNTDERPEASYSAQYFGGEPEDYDVIKPAPDNGYNVYATDGNTAAYAEFWNSVVALRQIRVRYTSKTGAPGPGQNVTQLNSGATGTIAAIDGASGFAIITVRQGTFTSNAADQIRVNDTNYVVPDAAVAIEEVVTDKSAHYQQLLGNNPDGTRNPAFPVHLDVDNMIDYMMVIFYGGNLDAPLSNFLGNTSPNNYFASRNRNGETGWKFYVHDAEHTLLNVNEDRTGPYYPTTGFLPFGKANPQSMFEILVDNPEFRLRVADRMHKWFHNDGVLTPAVFTQMFDARKNEMDPAIVAESARWGDANPGRTNSPITKTNWLNAIANVRNSYIPARTNIVFDDLVEDGLYTSVLPPNFNQHGGLINDGFALTITSPNVEAGEIYYTLDGRDPRKFGGARGDTSLLYTGPITLNASTVVKARVLIDGSWSALTETTFRLNLSALRVSEIHYNPVVPAGSGFTSQDFEYIELVNTGSTPINPAGASFSEGIEFTFPSTPMAPGARVLLVRNRVAFESLYGEGLPIAGMFAGFLNDNGEQLKLNVGNAVVFDFAYDDDWYPITDGGGYSLVALNPAQAPTAFSTKAGWKASETVNGTPGANEAGPTPGIVVINEVMSNPATGGDWIELRNTTGAPVNIGGWWLSNDALNLKKYQIPAGTTIGTGASGFIVFTEAGHFGDPSNPGVVTPFSISHLGDDIFLSNNGVGSNLGGYREGVDFGAAALGVPFGRYTKSTSGVDFVAMSSATQGSANALPQFGPVVMSEIMYNPLTGGHEYIELHNLTGAEFSLYDAVTGNGWKFNEGVDFTFGASAAVPGSGYALVVGIDPALFRSTYNIPASVPIYGPWTGVLSDGGENVKLSKPGTPEGVAPNVIVPYIIVDQVNYNDAPPWPLAADGLGASMTRVPVTAYGNDAGNWTAALGGNPGGPFVQPRNPYALSATTTGTSTVQLNWIDYSNDEAGFRIERSTDNVNFTLIGTAGLNAQSYGDSGLSQNTRYFYRVKAYNNAGESSYSNKASALTGQSTTLNLIGAFTEQWKYNHADNNLGTAWRAPAYTEPAVDGWLGPAGGLFYVEPSALPGPKTTPLVLDAKATPTGVTPTFYFRKGFNLSVNPSTITALTLNTILDDGAVIYINGTRVFDIGFTTGAAITHTTYLNSVGGRTIDNAFVETWNLPQSAINALVQGTNVIAVEVHQINNTSSDIVWSATLTATTNATAPTVTPDVVDVTPDPRPSGVDTMTINFSSPVTGLDLSDLSLSRNGGPNLLGPTQTLLSSNGGATWTLGNLKGLTWVAGDYTLVLLAGNSGIVATVGGTPIGPDALDTFKVTTTSVSGTTGNDNYYVRVNASTLEVFQSAAPVGSPAYSAPVSEVSSLTINGDNGNDVVELGSVLPFQLQLVGGGGTDGLILGTGNTTFAGDLGTGFETLTLNAAAQLTLGASQHLRVLTLNGTSRMTLGPGAAVLDLASSLAMSATAFLDLGDADMVVHTSSAAARQQVLDLITARIRASRAGAPRWSTAGIRSTLAASNPTVVGIGVIPNNVGAGGAALYPNFAGEAVDANAVLVKTTYYGDHDLDGDVDADDYAAIDSGYAQGLSGWYNGDNDLSGGRINADDYFLIDRSFAGQGAPLTSPAVAPAAAPASAEVVEEEVVAAPTQESAPTEVTAPTEVETAKPATFSTTLIADAKKTPAAKAVAVDSAAVLAVEQKKAKKKSTRREFEF
jgi:hypothetical protein